MTIDNIANTIIVAGYALAAAHLPVAYPILAVGYALLVMAHLAL